MVWRSSMMALGLALWPLSEVAASPNYRKEIAAASSNRVADVRDWSLAQTPTSTADRDQLETGLLQLHPDIVAVRPSSSTSLYEDGTEFTAWSPAITLRAGLSIETQQAIALTAAEYVIDFQIEKSGALIPPNPDYPVAGGIVLFVKFEDDSYPQIDFISFSVLSRSPAVVEISQRILTEDDYAETVVARFAEGQFTAIAANQPNLAETAATLLDTGFAQLYQEANLAAAEASFDVARQLFRDRSDVRGEYDALRGLVAVYDQTNRIPAGTELLQRQAEIAQSLVDPLKLRGVAGELQCRAEWDAAIANYGAALDVYRRNRPDVFDLREVRSVLDQDVTTLVGMAQTHIQAGQLDEAEGVLREAITLLDQIFTEAQRHDSDNDFNADADIRRLTEWYSEPFSSTNLYQMLQHVLIRQGRTDEALVAIEQGRTQGLEELWAIKQPGERLRPPSLEEMRAIARQQDATLVTYSFDTFIDNCDGNITPPQLLTWVIKPTGDIQFHQQSVELSALPNSPNDVQNLVEDTRLALGARGIDIIAANPEINFRGGDTEIPYLRSLHQLLIEPIAATLSPDPSDRIIFIPDFVLFMVPFPALQAPDGTYLVERHTPLTAPSIQALSLTAQSRQRSLPARSNPLIVGNPTYPPINLLDQQLNLDPLPWAEQEARHIADLLETEPLIGDAATKTAILQRFSEASVMHFATHGLLEGVTPFDLPGAIAVAQSTGGQTELIDLPYNQRQVSFSDLGLIDTNEILLFRLQAELVVLSACNTGGGNLTGDGINGLSRAFIASGVPSVIVSLWSVPDAPTGQLMTTFYEEWLGGSDKATALRTAMLETMAAYPDPINWAAFTLIGEAE
ncbi:CHAT domain-containing protein [Halomicronema sp. CCY15110]|uniref:CHAT domain-containing protein n=1 Tax=Halomicronema sp. CCY15110 TaxID=2767773 RepID=UPI001950CBEE|nr:CHAT domain-containing protein [Halomicronema sp. CCY15110]